MINNGSLANDEQILDRNHNDDHDDCLMSNDMLINADSLEDEITETDKQLISDVKINISVNNDSSNLQLKNFNRDITKFSLQTTGGQFSPKLKPILNMSGPISLKRNRHTINAFNFKKIRYNMKNTLNNSLEVKLEDVIKVIDNFDVNTNYKMQLLVNIENSTSDSSSYLISFFASLELIDNQIELQLAFEKMQEFFLLIKNMAFSL